MKENSHTFFIPVMGTGFTIDTPLKVAKYGISSVISLVDDTLIEEMRKFYCQEFGEKYEEISASEVDCRARRITGYLNLLDLLVKRQFDEVRKSAFELGSEITKYFDLLPESSSLKGKYLQMLKTQDSHEKVQIQESLRNSIQPGSIDVNIMTKLDRNNYDKNGHMLSTEFSDALAALRGYAKSTLDSAIIFSAGINQRLYNYVSEFKDFYADATGKIKKKIILKVSDYRSAFIQGKVFAKKGIWVSEYRVESGLNCGGHVFPSSGFLLGPILREFSEKRDEMIKSLHKIFNQALNLKNKGSFDDPLMVSITAQGGVGTAQEDKFLRTNYGIDGVGWGTPFLLCPEVTNVDEETLEKLTAAGEDDLYTSTVSPMGVPFNNIRGNSFDILKEKRIKEGNPGSPCSKGHLRFDTEFTEMPVCLASAVYQKKKLAQLQQLDLSDEELRERTERIVEKACICHHLGTGALVKKNIIPDKSRPSCICPGPNLAYYDRLFSLKELVDHIYGRASVLARGFRPNLFLKELNLYFSEFVKEAKHQMPFSNPKQLKHFENFKSSLLEGIEYYLELFPRLFYETEEFKNRTIEELKNISDALEEFVFQYDFQPAPERSLH